MPPKRLIVPLSEPPSSHSDSSRPVAVKTSGPRSSSLAASFAPWVEMLQRVIGEDYSIVVESAADLPCCRIDPGQLELAILNLVVNARDAMPDGGIIEIKIEAAPPPNAASNSPRTWNRNGDLPPSPPADSDSYVCIRIRDSGVGIAPDVFERIFEPFFTTKDVGRGSGLGLSTVLGIVKQSRGYVGVQSEIGRGSTFSLFLPSVTDAPPTVSPNSRPPRPARGHILLVEDDPAIRTMLVTVLRDAGYEVSVSSDGIEASELASAATTPYDLLLSDVVMPRRTGIELARELRARWKTLPVLFISGYTQRGSSPLTPIPPDTRLLPKPFSIDDLLRAVSDTINESA
jgi:two-component system cell cycle sensor histidine kinase/response regulator CckA